jgi:hypothetical protein
VLADLDEISVNEMLSDPIVHTVMRADAVNRETEAASALRPFGSLKGF